MQINQSNLTKLYEGLRVIYMEAYQGGAPFWEKLAMRTTSTQATELYKWLGSIPGMKEFLGEANINNLASHGFQIVNKEFDNVVAIPQADVERDSYGVYNPLFSAMGLAARQHKDELLAEVMVNGFDEVCYTGKAFFAADHEPQKGGKKFSNKATKKFSQANFRTARTNIKSRLNAKGRAMNLGIDLMLVVSPKNEDAARETLLADRNANGATNTDKGTAKLEVWPQLAGLNEDAWFLLEAGMPVKPFIVQVEKDTSFAALTNPDSEHVMTKHEFLYGAYGRYNAGYGLPELAYGSDGSTAA